VIFYGEKGAGDWFFSEYFVFALSVTFPQWSIFVFIYILLLSGETTEPGKFRKLVFSKIGSYRVQNYINLDLRLPTLCE
jgi:hypothetical protein